MMIQYNYGTKGKTEGDEGIRTCPNCGKEAHMSLFKEIGYVDLFGVIPIYRKTRTRGILCEHCGDMQLMDKQEYEEEKRRLGQ